MSGNVLGQTFTSSFIKDLVVENAHLHVYDTERLLKKHLKKKKIVNVYDIL